jgi:N-methylhydantoinase A
MSAFGMLVSPRSFQLAKSARCLWKHLTPADFAAHFAALEEAAADFLLRTGVPRAEITISRRLDVRYAGQGYEVADELPESRDIAALLPRIPELFARRYAEIYTSSDIGEPDDIVNWKVEASEPPPAFADFHFAATNAGGDADALKNSRPAYFPKQAGFVECPVYDRYALTAGARIAGPALIEEREATSVIGPGDSAFVDLRGNLVISIEREAA